MRAIVSLVACALTACATTSSGLGTGLLEAPGKPIGDEVLFQWYASPVMPRHGTIEAALADGRLFRGRFVQVTSETQSTELDPLWSAWGGPWRGYGPLAPEAWPAFVHDHAGRVLAHLETEGGERMMCAFQIARPGDGPASGGIGDCDISTGERVEHAVLRSS
jgi:hypothetical protein